MNDPSLTTAQSRLPGWFVRTDARPGIPASRSDLHGQVEGLVDGLGAALRQLHDVDPLPAATVDMSSKSHSESAAAGSERDSLDPALFGWEFLAAAIRKNVEEGNVDPASLPHPYSRYDARKLLEFWLEGKPESGELVLSHGNPRLANLYFDGADFVGASDLANVCYADRHLDLAVLHHEIHEHLGAEAVFRFYEAYGQDPILVRLDHYLLASYLFPTSVSAL